MASGGNGRENRSILGLPGLTFGGVVLAAALVILAVQLGAALVQYARHAAAAVQFPYPLEYGEGPILDQVLRLARFETIYRASLAAPPYTVTRDPPLYHLLQVPFVWAVGPAYWYGRALSFLSAVLAALLLGLTLHTVTHDRIAAVISGALLLAFPYVIQWSALNRVDTLALALSWAGLYAVVRWPDARRGVVLGMILFTAAVYTQPAYALVGPGTALIWLLQGRRRGQALRFAGGLVGAVLALFLLLNLLTQGGFFFNLVTANVSAASHIGFMANATGLFINAWVLVLGAAGFLVVERWWYPTRSWPLVLPYVLLAGVSLLLAGRAGAGVNTLYEPAAALCLAAGAVVAWPKSNYLLKTGAVLLIALQVSGLNSWWRSDFAPVTLSKFGAADEIARLAEIVREAPGPVLADEYMGLLPLAGRPIEFQPFEFYQLERAGLWQPDALVEAVERQAFSAVLLYEPNFGPPLIVSRWSPAVRGAIWAHYEQPAHLAGTWVYFPGR